MIRRTIVLALCLCCAAAATGHAQQKGVLQSGLATPGHPVIWVTNGVIGDGGSALNGNLTELGITNTGTPFCINDAPITGKYHQFCLGATALGGGLISYQPYGGALAQPLQLCANGTCQSFPFNAVNTTPLGLTPETFGCVGDMPYEGSTGTDNTTCLTNWIAAGQAGQALFLPAKTYGFKTCLTNGNNLSGFSLVGAGSGVSGLRYFGAATNCDVLKLGTLSTESVGVRVQGLRVSSATIMTQGYGIHFVNFAYSNLPDVQVGVQDRNLWNGFFCEACSFTNRSMFNDQAQNDVEVCAGNTIAAPNPLSVGMNFALGLVENGVNGFHAGGGCSGSALDDAVDIIGNTTNVLYDTAIDIGVGNGQLFLGSTSQLDTPTTDNIVINQSVSSIGPQLVFVGWVASAPRYGIFIEACQGCQITLGGTVLANVQGGVRLADSGGGAIAWLMSTANVYNNAGTSGYGIDCIPSTYNRVRSLGLAPYSNGPSGNPFMNINPNCQIGSLGGYANGIPFGINPNTAPQTITQGVVSGSLIESEVLNTGAGVGTNASTSVALNTSGADTIMSEMLGGGGLFQGTLTFGPGNTGGNLIVTNSNPFFISGLPASPGTAGTLCINISTSQIYAAPHGSPC